MHQPDRGLIIRPLRICGAGFCLSLAFSCVSVHDATHTRVQFETVPEGLELFHQGRRIDRGNFEITNFIAEDYTIAMRKGDEYVGAREMLREIKPPAFAAGVLTLFPLLWSYGARPQQRFDMSAYFSKDTPPAAGPGFRDEVHLKDGRKFARVRAAVTETSIVITAEDGNQIVIAKSLVARIIRGQ